MKPNFHYTILLTLILRSTMSYMMGQHLENTIPSRPIPKNAQEDIIMGFLDDLFLHNCNTRPEPIPAAPSKLSMKIKLFEAIEKGKINKVKKLIERRVNINKPRWLSNGPRPISIAINIINTNDSENNLKIIELLIQAGAKINESVNFGIAEVTPLSQAISYKEPNLNVIKLLLGYGAQITDKILFEARIKPNALQLEDIFSHHLNLLNH